MRQLAIVMFILTLSGSPARAAQDDARAAFDKLKTLVGDWDGKSRDGKPVHVSYELISIPPFWRGSITAAGLK